MYKVVKGKWNIWHKPCILNTVEFFKLADRLFECKRCCKSRCTLQTCLRKQVPSIGNRICICTERNCPGTSIIFHQYTLPCRMDKRFFTANLGNKVGRDWAKGVHAYQTTDPSGTYM